jgi:hypothetical protein
MKISQETIEQIKMEYPDFIIEFKASLNDFDDTAVIDANYLRLFKSDEHGKIRFVSIKAPKNKELTFEFICAKMSCESSYKNLSQYLGKLFPGAFLFATSYGIGFSAFAQSDATVKKNSQFISDKLISLGINFRTEYSDAYWIYRFVISKSVKNISILESIN